MNSPFCPPTRQYEPDDITQNSVYPSLVPQAQGKGMLREETRSGISSSCS